MGEWFLFAALTGLSTGRRGGLRYSGFLRQIEKMAFVFRFNIAFCCAEGFTLGIGI